ncbi:MAG: SMP-30/gluconolactonase/LRE family protein [Bacteroidota bacterium]
MNPAIGSAKGFSLLLLVLKAKLYGSNSGIGYPFYLQSSKLMFMKWMPICGLLLALLACNNTKESKQKMNKPQSEPQAKLWFDSQNTLGEGAFWNVASQEFVWVDIEGEAFFISDGDPKSVRKVVLNKKIGTIVPDDKGDFVIALENGIYQIERESESLSLLANPEADLPNNRMNDGKCDPAGRLWVGSMSMKNEGPVGALYRIEADGQSEKMVSPVSISNGIIWSLDQKTMYYIDTGLGNVRAYDYDIESGDITNERVIIEVPGSLGYPDGMTIDAEGKLWIALWNGHAVSRWDPDTGKLLQTIEVPALNVTSCAFGGPDLETLYITSARIATTLEQLETYPAAGGVFTVKPGVKGVPSPVFKTAE